MARAIVIVGKEGSPIDASIGEPSVRGRTSLACVDVLGASPLRRSIERMTHEGVESVALFGDVPHTAEFDEIARVNFFPRQQNFNSRVAETIEQSRKDPDPVLLILRVGSYVEIDFLEALKFHRDRGGRVSRGFYAGGVLDFWMLDPNQFDTPQGLVSAANSMEPVYYEVTGYVNRLADAGDLRSLAADGLNSRCRLRPLGFEVRPGVWMAPGAQVAKNSRVVSPAFIGRDVTVSEQCLITRCSNIERDSFVDYGTVVEDSSILPNSYVGIGLELSHSVVERTSLLNLTREVVLHVTDAAVLRQNKPDAEESCYLRPNAASSDLTFSTAEESST